MEDWGIRYDGRAILDGGDQSDHIAKTARRVNNWKRKEWMHI
jgi:hypothetical protein